MNASPLLAVEQLDVTLRGRTSGTPIVRGISFDVRPGDTLGIVGESGCGKTMSMLAIAGLVPEHAEVRARSVQWRSEEVGLTGLHRMMGSHVGFVFQDAVAALNPLMPVGAQVGETLRRKGASRKEAATLAVGLLDEVGLDDPERCARLYPWEVSGGMAQRILIAMALAPGPDLLIADEPTTAIDANARSHVLTLLDELQRTRGLAVLLVSHDLAVVRSQASDIAVMYAGRIVEHGDTDAVKQRPRHPYTRALLDCTLDPFSTSPLAPIPGEPPRPSDVGPDCAFRPRCAQASTACMVDPALCRVGEPGDVAVACWHPQEVSR